MSRNDRAVRLRLRPAPEKLKRRLPDMIALLTFLSLAVLLVISVQYGIQNGDETNYIAGANHLLRGDRLFVGYWSLLQLFDLFLCIPLKLCLSVLGGTEGVVLAMRYVYVGIKLLFFWLIYISFRKYRYWAVLGAVIVTAYHPMGFFTITYYTIAPAAALLIGTILFIRSRYTKFECVLCGVIFACCVLAEPFTALVYLGYTLLVLLLYLRRKKGKDLMDPAQVLRPGVWRLITLGVLITAAAFLLYLFVGVGFGELKENMTALLSGSFFANNVGTQTNLLKKLTNYFGQMGYGANIAAVILLLLLAFGRKRLQKQKLLLFAAVCAVFIWMTATAFLWKDVRTSAIYLTDYKPVPLCFLGAASYLLSEKKDRRLLEYYIFCLGISWGTDAFSSVSLGSACVCMAPVCVCMFRQAFIEAAENVRSGFAQKKEAAGKKRTKKKNPLLRALLFLPATCCLAVLVVSESCYCMYARWFQLPELTACEPLTERLEKGPLKGLYTLPILKEKYDAVLSDMDTVQLDDSTVFFVMGDMEWCALYLDTLNATYSTEPFVTEESRETLPVFWSMHPEKKPDIIYVPFSDCDSFYPQPEIAAEKLSYLQTLCTCEVEEGAGGYILHVRSWKTA